MPKKDKNKKRLLSGSDIALAILAALGGSVLFMTIVAVAGSIMFPDSGRRVTAEAQFAQPSYYGTLPSRAPTQANTPEAVKSIASGEMNAPEATQTPSEAVTDTPAPSQAQTREPATPTRAPAPTTAPTRAPATQNPAPAISINPTVPPAQATRPPAQSGNSGTVRNRDGTYTHNFSGGRVLATTQSNNNGDPVYHTEDCRAARIIPPENERWYESAQAAENDNRRLCGYCAR